MAAARPRAANRGQDLSIVISTPVVPARAEEGSGLVDCHFRARPPRTASGSFAWFNHGNDEFSPRSTLAPTVLPERADRAVKLVEGKHQSPCSESGLAPGRQGGTIDKS